MPGRWRRVVAVFAAAPRRRAPMPKGRNIPAVVTQGPFLLCREHAFRDCPLFLPVGKDLPTGKFMSNFLQTIVPSTDDARWLAVGKVDSLHDRPQGGVRRDAYCLRLFAGPCPEGMQCNTAADFVRQYAAAMQVDFPSNRSAMMASFVHVGIPIAAEIKATLGERDRMQVHVVSNIAVDGRVMHFYMMSITEVQEHMKGSAELQRAAEEIMDLKLQLRAAHEKISALTFLSGCIVDDAEVASDAATADDEVVALQAELRSEKAKAEQVAIEKDEALAEMKAQHEKKMQEALQCAEEALQCAEARHKAEIAALEERLGSVLSRPDASVDAADGGTADRKASEEEAAPSTPPARRRAAVQGAHAGCDGAPFVAPLLSAFGSPPLTPTSSTASTASLSHDSPPFSASLADSKVYCIKCRHTSPEGAESCCNKNCNVSLRFFGVVSDQARKRARRAPFSA